MKLQEWITDACMTQSEFALKIGKSQAFVSQLCSGRHKPSIEVAQEIHEFTHSQVGLEDW